MYGETSISITAICKALLSTDRLVGVVSGRAEACPNLKKSLYANISTYSIVDCKSERPTSLLVLPPSSIVIKLQSIDAGGVLGSPVLASEFGRSITSWEHMKEAGETTDPRRANVDISGRELEAGGVNPKSEAVERGFETSLGVEIVILDLARYIRRRRTRKRP